jgi:diguanylate cyclase (GGDEF)-like protein
MTHNDNEFVLSILEHMDIAVFRRIGPGKYVFFGNIPKFYNDTFKIEHGEVCFDLYKLSDMLEFFIQDAEQLFETGADGKLESGMWREDGMPEGCALTATAVKAGNSQYIALRCHFGDYVERLRIMQSAREQLLEQRKLSTSLEAYKVKASHDVLTGLLNRSTLMEILSKEAQSVKSTGKTFSFILMDIDNFKKVNDTYGHLVGDVVLVGISKIIMRHMRRNDYAIRYGGEELVIVASSTTSQEAFVMAEHLRRFIEAYDFNLPHNITVSIGCTAYIQGEPLEEMIERADNAMYEGKRLTKNIVVVR